MAACRAMMRGGSRSFSAAALLLPRRVHEPATALYAFCRLADDLVDDGAQDGALDALRRRLDLAYDGRPADHPADRAFARVVADYHVPRGLPSALLEGFAWDLQARRYATLEDLLDYAARVAGSVGAMMAVLMGARSAESLARACDLGVAMQLTNIARDVGEDAFSPALAGVTRRLLQVADGLYVRGGAGIAGLPLACRPGIRAAAALYAEIGHALARSGCDSVNARARVPGRRKMVLLAGALAPAFSETVWDCAAALPACQYLVDEAAVPVRRKARVDWVFDLFERLQEQQLGMS